MVSYTLTTSAAIIYKAGANANTGGANSAAMLAMFSDEAEVQLCANTRYNWITNYSLITANLKPLLDDATSDLAAMKVISFDMSGFTSRAEAQTMLDVLRDNSSKIITLLQDQKTLDFMKA